jgi:hypothetical protein
MPNEVSILLAFTLVKGLFGAPVGFVLGFFAKLILLFAASAVVSKILHLERAYEQNEDHASKKNS